MRKAVLDAMMIDRCSCGGYTATPEVGVWAFTMLFLGTTRLSIFLDVLRMLFCAVWCVAAANDHVWKTQRSSLAKGVSRKAVMTWRHVTVRTSSNKLHERSGCSSCQSCPYLTSRRESRLGRGPSSPRMEGSLPRMMSRLTRMESVS